jgi:CheY-like chemotaxis protein
MTMPELTGAALAVKLLAIRPEMPILMCTGFSDQIDEEKAFAIGIRGFLLKPVNLKKLTSNIRQLLDQT